MENEINIPRNKKTFNKLLFLIPLTFIPIVRVIFKNFETNIILSVLLSIYCVLMVLFFINAIKKTNKTSPALIIDNSGLTDNISLANAGLIAWDEITNFEILKSAGHPHLFVFVKNPKKFIENKSWFTKGMITQLNKDKGSPIAIDLNQIDIDSKELLKILYEFKEKTLKDFKEWKPISITELNIEIQKTENDLEVEIMKFWKSIKIKPEKWIEKEFGQEGGGFWVVAIFENNIIWYNDIEDGFNISKFKKIGEIDEYYCEQDQLNWTVIKLYNSVREDL